jgi:cysteine synthase
MIEEAEKRGEIIPGQTRLVEPTSGNTGIGLAMVAATKGYPLTIVMPSTMSLERRVMLRALGADLVLTPGDKGIKGALAVATRIVEETNGYMFNQFSNPDNPKIHRETTGPEIWYQTDGNVDILIGGVGTGGTISGCTQFIKQLKPSLYSIAVEPEDSPVLSGGNPGPHKIQGIGAGIVPDNFDRSVIDEIMTVSTQESVDIARALALKEGVFVGISSGAAVSVALRVAALPENAGLFLPPSPPSPSPLIHSILRSAQERTSLSSFHPSESATCRPFSLEISKRRFLSKRLCNLKANLST